MAQSYKSRWQDAAFELLEKQYGSIDQFRIHQTWGDRIVLEVGTSHFPNGLILKASADKSCQSETYAAKLARSAGVPVPRILSEGMDDRLPGNYWFVISKAEGQPWESIAQSDVQRSRSLDDVGHFLQLLHRVRMWNFGPLMPGGGGLFTSWAGWLRSELLSCSQPLIQERFLPSRFMLIVDDVLTSLSSHLDTIRPSLLHGDLGDGEIFVDPTTGAVTALVDWGDALSGDPLYEFARLVAGGSAGDERPGLYLPGVRSSYAKHSGSDDVIFEGKVPDLYEFHNAVRNAFWCLREERSWIEGLCAHAITILSKLTRER